MALIGTDDLIYLPIQGSGCDKRKSTQGTPCIGHRTLFQRNYPYVGNIGKFKESQRECMISSSRLLLCFEDILKY